MNPLVAADRMSISPRTLVRLKRDPLRAGMVLEGEKTMAGSPMAPVQFADGVKWLPLSALEPIPLAPENCSDRFAAGRFVEPDWLRRTLTRLRVTGRLSDVVYSMEATKTDFYAYQFKPVIKLMNSPTDALLIADEVGLGKTIEAGLVWTELRARLDCHRLLVTCPKTLCQKWQNELATRFGVDAQIAEAKELLGALRRARDIGQGFALICSMQGLRPPKGWNDDESDNKNARGAARRDLARFLDEASDGEPLIDLLVVDEAHHMRNPETLLNDFSRLANSVASHRLFLSATPIHLKNRDLHSLLAMVDPDTFEFESTLNDLIATNAPIIAARDLLLSKAPVAKVLERLDEAQGHEILSGSKALPQLRQELKLNSETPNSAKRSELAARLERINQLADYVTRTRRRDVEEFRVIGNPQAPALAMSPDERCFYDEISEVVMDYALDRDVNDQFLLSTPRRLLTSSLAAASAYWSGLLGADGDEIEESDQDLQTPSLDKRPLTAIIAKHARALNMTARLTEVDTKYRLLIGELRQLWDTEAEAKIIVFSSFKPTLHYLRDRLREEGIGTELLHGSVKRPREEILSRFERDDAIRVLLASEVGSEGVDLQFCWIVVNYDLPWNPMRLEQRIGRVDRLGQEKDKVTIVNLVYDLTIDYHIYWRLYHRLQIGQRALGAMEPVLGELMDQMTKRLLNPKLTPDETKKVIDQTALALETRRNIEEQLENQAGSLVHHGDYILQRITESRERHRWLRADDILIYVRDRILRDFPGSVVETSPPGSDTYRIRLSDEGAAAFQDYLSRHGIKGRTRVLSGDAQQRFRFSRSVVEKDGRVEHISQLHPLVRFAAQCDLRDNTEAQAVAARVSLNELLEKAPAECTRGIYVLAARHWSSGAGAAGTMANVRIGYAGAYAWTGKLIGADLAEWMMAAAAEHGQPILNAAMHSGLADATRILRDVVQPELDRRFGEFVTQAEAEIADRIAIRHRSLVRHFENKVATIQEQKNSLSERLELPEIIRDTRKATNMKNLVAAHGVRIEKLRRSQKLRESELEGQREITPTGSDVGCLFLQVAE